MMRLPPPLSVCECCWAWLLVPPSLSQQSVLLILLSGVCLHFGPTTIQHNRMMITFKSSFLPSICPTFHHSFALDGCSHSTGQMGFWTVSLQGPQTLKLKYTDTFECSIADFKTSDRYLCFCGSLKY